jgi:O-antigen ligase
MAAIVLSLSRTAIAVAVLQGVLLLLFELRYAPRQFVRRAALLVPVALAMGLLVTSVPALNQRFFTAEFNVVEIGGIPVSTSGRSNVWPAVIASAQRHPIIGQGWGSSQQVTASLWGAAEIGHPHNDYLRVWHDAGWIGLTLFALALGIPARSLFLGARTHLRTRQSPPHGAMALAGLLALSGILLAAITDNAIVYPFVMSPLGILIGVGIAAVRRTQDRARFQPAGAHR